ncbi:MAG: amino acid adenylation domain-containing protein, partial [Candidatus Aminicenantes bacterium]|nr:amino acid adenylation domain-containing protein [Candidatus Aminicenantes bacterium]
LGILKSGSGYVPLDPKAPAARNKFVLEECGTSLLLTTRSILGKSENVVLAGWPGEILFLEQLDELKAKEPDVVGGYKSNMSNMSYPAHLSYTAYVIFTSGSTGKPKGVPITHANFCPLMHWGYEKLGIGPTDRAVQNLSYYFDWSVWEIFIALTGGAALYMITEKILLNPEAEVDFILKKKITVLHITPTQYQYLMSVGKKLHTLKYLSIGAEKLTYDLTIRSLTSVSEDCRVFNMYGPTEATIMAAVLEIDRTKVENYKVLSSVPIGETIANTNLLVLDKQKKLCPIGIEGELYIAGDAVARGYLNNPELTAEKFITAPAFSSRPQPDTGNQSPLTLYRTGDRCRWLEDGTVEFLGRIDDQVKIRGFRIEPGEIENRLLQHKTVKEAFVMVRQYDSGENYLCAYIVASSKEQGAGSEEMREYLSRKLPDYMIPSSFVFIEQMPLNPNGKVDIKALPAPELISLKGYLPPGNKVEGILVDTWALVLELDKTKIGIDDDFFELGGHSLSVTRLAGKIHKALDVEIPFSVVFTTPTIRGIAEYIEKEKKDKKYVEILPVEKKEYYPISSAQGRFFLLQRMGPETTAYNISGIMQLDGSLKKEVFEKGFKRLIDRHESLRTSFEMLPDGPVQKIRDFEDIEFGIEFEENPKLQNTNSKQITSFKTQIPNSYPQQLFSSAGSHTSDLSDTSHSEKKGGRQEEYDDFIHNSVPRFIRPFDLSKAPLLRVGLLKIEEEKHLLMVDMHHIISDGISIELLLHDFAALLADRELPPLNVSYKDYTGWQHTRAYRDMLMSQAAFWEQAFAGEIPVLELPTDYTRPAVQDFEGRTMEFQLTGEETRALNRFSLEQRSTLFMTLLAIYTLFLSKITDQQDIVVGTPVSGRRSPDIDLLVGLFVNTLALRNYVPVERTFAAFLAEVKESTLQAFENQDYPYEYLIEKLIIKRDISRNPLFDSMFVLQGAGIWEMEIPGLKRSSFPYAGRTSKFDLTLQAQH